VNEDAIRQVLWGALTMSAWVAGLFFLRFWRTSRDRVFLFLGIAFWILALNWLGLALIHRVEETRHYIFVLRLLAFVLIIVGVLDKNHRGRQ